MDFNENIGRLVSAWRKARGMSQESLASAIGVGQAAVSKMEQGKQAISVQQLVAILRATDMDLSAVANDILAAAEDDPSPLWERFND